MLKKTLIAGLLVAMVQGSSVYAQGSVVPGAENGNTGGKKYEHAIGVQINQLINQVFNFSNTTPAASSNPYLLTYNITQKKSNYGLRLGLGYNYTATSSADGATSTDTKINDLRLRVGIEKKFELTSKLDAGAGIDFLFQTNDDKTDVTFSTSFDTVLTSTKTTSTGFGGGAMGWLRYNFNKNISVGTEASFYYLTNDQTQTISTIDLVNLHNGYPIPDPVETKQKPASAKFALPVVFYMTVRF